METWLSWINALWGYGFAAVDLAIVLATSHHILLHKQSEQASVAWLGFVWLVPVLGAGLYFLFGVNRIQRKAGRLRGASAPPPSPERAREAVVPPEWSSEHGALARLGLAVHAQPYAAGNTVRPLVDGDQAYPAMLAAIARARESIALSTYIFEPDAAGRQFVDALAGARQRGVAVRAILDDVGTGGIAGLRFGRIDTLLAREGIKTARFIPTRLGRWVRFVNLRSHRKLLLVDGREAFLGGMNIHGGNLLRSNPRRPTRDLHFQIRGPVIAQLNRVFEEDWEFTTGEAAALPGWPPEDLPPGEVSARALPGGPDDPDQRLRWMLLGALAVAQHRVRILTPYFLPDDVVHHALAMAAYRGVRVEIVLPQRSDVRLVDWAVRANLSRLLDAGMHVYFSPPPFDHSKLLLVDRDWVLIGSSNWDARSLRLNFELDLECIHPALAGELAGVFEDRREAAARVTHETLRDEAAWRKVRNQVARLASPYL